MSTHHHVKTALEKAIAAHKRAHQDHLERAGLAEHTESTVSPLGPSGDMDSPPGGDDG